MNGFNTRLTALWFVKRHQELTHWRHRERTLRLGWLVVSARAVY